VPDKAIYMQISRFLEMPPWQVEAEMTLDWYHCLMAWMEEQPSRNKK